ncbi:MULTISPECIES: chemotaxis protein CheW [Vreelandella]|uniref:Chemotaxis protein CheW n=2 Tax=Vreelandella TaxID=3137766 RepID=A0A7C9P083_9GAMM|nr:MULTISPECIES: chemotaxis protein CheW [Halomonas]NDL69213.1 chemotaxis protein CheW [Halomonas alkaliphila]NYS44090.1 chemotaxis protein CheW [Halomonas zhaodongensis]
MTDYSQQNSETQRISLDEALAHQSDDLSIIDVDEPCQQLVLFRIANQRFALPGSAVNEILSGDQPVYFVPGLPASTEGVIHLRGNIESVITLQALLDLPPTEQTGMLLLVTAAGIRSAIRIDYLDDVCDTPVSALKPAPDTLSSQLKPYVSALWQPETTFDEEVSDATGDNTEVPSAHNRAATVLLNPEALFNAYQQGLG